MVPSHFDKNDTQVFVEIFAVPVNGTIFKFSVQRRFMVAEKWIGDMESMPVCPDRDHYGTPFVPADVAVMLLQMGVLKIPVYRSWCVEYAGNGCYFDDGRDALSYCVRRWPAAMAMFTDRLNLGAPLEISPSREAAFKENSAKIKPWKVQADALAEQIRNANAAPAEG